MRTRLSLLALVVAILSINLSAQKGKPPGGGNPTGGNSNVPNVFSRPSNRDVRVEIQVTDENSMPVNDQQFMVELGGLGGPQQRTYVDSNGRASFSVPGGTTYRVSITGGEIETTTNTFELYPDETNHREMIAVKFKKDAKTGAPGGIISATNLNIPSKARNEFSKGMQEMNDKRWESAKKHFLKAISEYPKYDWAYNNLGVVEIELKDEAGAKAAFTKAVELNDKNADAATNLAQTEINENNFEGAKSLLKKALMVQPKSSKDLMMLAYAELKTNEVDAALANAEKVHQGDPDPYPLAHFLAARIRESRGDLTGAERQYQAYLKESPEGPQAGLAKEALVRVQAKN